jgi:hypothetical protein
MTKSAPTFDEVDYPYPPRFRWLKRIAKADRPSDFARQLLRIEHRHHGGANICANVPQPLSMRPRELRFREGSAIDRQAALRT